MIRQSEHAIIAHSTYKYEIIPEDIYNCFILDFVKEVAKFLAAKNQAQVNAFHYVMTSLVPAPCEVSRRKVDAKLAKFSEIAMEYAGEHKAVS